MVYAPNRRAVAARLAAPAAAIVLMAGLAACGGGTVLRSGDACNGGGAQGIVGGNRAAADAFAAQLNSGGSSARVSGPDDVLTTDVNPSRLNLILDGTGTVISVACG